MSSGYINMEPAVSSENLIYFEPNALAQIPAVFSKMCSAPYKHPSKDALWDSVCVLIERV